MDMFMEIDKDHSGEIDIKELIHFVRYVVHTPEKEMHSEHLLETFRGGCVLLLGCV